jgi:hypothetical protein
MYGDFAQALGRDRNDMTLVEHYHWATEHPGAWNAFQTRLGGQGFSTSAKGTAWRQARTDAQEALIADALYRQVFNAAPANERRVTEAAMDVESNTTSIRASGGGEPNGPENFPDLQLPNPSLVPGGRPPGACAMPRAAQAVIDALAGLAGELIRVTRGGFYRNAGTGEIRYRAPCQNCEGIVALNHFISVLPLPLGIPEGLLPGETHAFLPPAWWV